MSSSNGTIAAPATASADLLGTRGGRPPASRAGPRRASWVRKINWGLPLSLILPTLIIGLWELATRLQWVEPIMLPSPLKVLQTARDLFAEGLLLTDFWASLKIVLQGFFWGALSGLALGAYAGLSKNVERFFGPTLDAIRQVPPLAVLPLIILWVGVGDLGKIVVISKSVFFPVFLNTLQGIRGVQKEYVEVGRVFRLTRWQFARRIIIPGALPSILVGVRFGAGFSWALIVAAEILSGHSGLGYLIQRSQDLLFTDQMFVAIVVIALFGLILDRSLLALERYLLRWKQGYAG